MTATLLTLIAAPNTDVLDPSLLDQIKKALPGAEALEWLSPREACEIVFARLPEQNIRHYESDIREIIGDLPIDIAFRSKENARKKLLIADMDSTIIEQECIDEIADFAGVRAYVAEITERAMRGELNFEAALRERVALLKGLPESALEQVIAERLTLTSGAKTLVKTMAASGAFCALVSGGFTFFTSRIASMAGFHVNQANILEIEQGQLTGLVREPILGREAKREALLKFSAQNSIAITDTLAVGDGANDLAMITAAGLGVAFHAKPVVAAEADVRIDHGDLTALLYIQGYKREEFVSVS